MSKDNVRLNVGLVDVLREGNVSPQLRIKKAQYLIKLGADAKATVQVRVF